MHIQMLSVGGLIGLAVGIIIAGLLDMRRESNLLKRLNDIVGAGWETRLNGIRYRLRDNMTTSEDVKFLLWIIDIIRKD